MKQKTGTELLGTNANLLGNNAFLSQNFTCGMIMLVNQFMIFNKCSKFISLSIAFISTLLLSGCSTFPNEQRFRIESDPRGVHVTIKYKNEIVGKGKTPCAYNIPKRFSFGRPEYSFLFEQPGYFSRQKSVKAEWNKLEYGISFATCMPVCPLWIIIDYVSGNFWYFDKESCYVFERLVMTPEMTRQLEQERAKRANAERQRVEAGRQRVEAEREEERQRIEAKIKVLQQRQMNEIENIFARSEQNRSSTLVMKGFYLGMPIEDATDLFNHHLGCSINGWFEHDSNNIYQCVLKSESNEITQSDPVATFDDKNKLAKIVLRDDQINRLFNASEIHLERFMMKFAELFNTPAPQRVKTEVVDRSRPEFNAYGSATLRTIEITDEKTYVVRLVEDEHGGYFLGVRGGGKSYKLIVERPKWMVE